MVTCCSTSSAARPGHCVITCTQVFATSGYASTGSFLKAMMPQMKRRIAMLKNDEAIVQREVDERSESLLLHRVLEFERIGDHLLSGADSLDRPPAGRQEACRR